MIPIHRYTHELPKVNKFFEERLRQGNNLSGDDLLLSILQVMFFSMLRESAKDRNRPRSSLSFLALFRQCPLLARSLRGVSCIVAMLLRSPGFEISDRGTEVSAEDIAKSVKERRANILSPSALLTTSVSEFGNVMSRLQREGLKGIVKTVVGGAAVT